MNHLNDLSFAKIGDKVVSLESFAKLRHACVRIAVQRLSRFSEEVLEGCSERKAACISLPTVARLVLQISTTWARTTASTIGLTSALPRRAFDL